MIILGINEGHDAGWVVVQDGKILGAYEKERFSGTRHDCGRVGEHGWLNASLGRLGLGIGDVDMFASSLPVHRGLGESLIYRTGVQYEAIDEVVLREAELLGVRRPCLQVPHHLAHAAYARFTSPFSECAVVTLDGGGDFYTRDAYAATTASLWSANGLLGIERLTNNDIGSLWFTYSRLIFNDPDAAGKLMGLAAYGDTELLDDFKRYFVRDATYLGSRVRNIKPAWPDFDEPVFGDGTMNDWRTRRAAQIAKAVQELTSDVGRSLFEVVGRSSVSGQLALSGGVALNGYLNTVAADLFGEENVWVPPAVDDGGLAAGVALFAYFGYLGRAYDPSMPREQVFLGMDYSPHHVQAAVRESDSDLNVSSVDPAKLAERLVDDLDRYDIVARYEGRAEFGPRALGNRSLIAVADDDRVRTVLNREVKLREAFRPLAPVVRHSDLRRYFYRTKRSDEMMYIVPCTEEGSHAAPATTHVDGSARVQTCREGSLFDRLLTIREDAGHVPILINTSFNRQGPIVNSPEEALRSFRAMPISVCYMGDLRLQKR